MLGDLSLGTNFTNNNDCLFMKLAPRESSFNLQEPTEKLPLPSLSVSHGLCWRQPDVLYTHNIVNHTGTMKMLLSSNYVTT